MLERNIGKYCYFQISPLEVTFGFLVSPLTEAFPPCFLSLAGCQLSTSELTEVTTVLFSHHVTFKAAKLFQFLSRSVSSDNSPDLVACHAIRCKPCPLNIHSPEVKVIKLQDLRNRNKGVVCSWGPKQ